MPKTMTFEVAEYHILRELLAAEVKKAKAAVARVEASIAAGKKNESWLRRPTEHLARVTKMYEEAMQPVMVERINLMSKQPYMEAEDTPNYCSPSSESYWSM